MKRTFLIKVLTRIQHITNRSLNYLEKREIDKVKNNFNKVFKESSFIDYKDDQNSIIRLYKDSVLSQCIVEGFEKDEEVFIKKFLRPGDIFMDIGANIGLHSIFGAKVVGESGRVYAFEPTPITYDRLQENINLNQLNKIIIPINKGISFENGTLQLNYSTEGYDAWNSFTQLSHINLSDTVEVAVSSFDSIISELNIDKNKLSLIKIDVEGWEMMVLKGAEEFLKSNLNTAFLIEFTDLNAISAGYCTRDIYRCMENFGYKWFTFDSKDMSFSPSPLKLNYPYENLIAVKDVQTLKNRI